MQIMCKVKTEGGALGGNRVSEAGQFEDYDGFACTVTIGNVEAMIGEATGKTKQKDVWLGVRARYNISAIALVQSIHTH